MADSTASALLATIPKLSTAAPHLDIAIADWSVRLRCSEASTRDVLAAYFAGFQTDELPDRTVEVVEMDPPELGVPVQDWKREPGKSGRKEVFAELPDGRLVGKVRTGMQFVVSDARKVALGPCAANPNQVINFVNALFMTQQLGDGWSLCHAAGVCQGDRGVAIAAASGGGKSTLALHLMEKGMGFVSNDRLLVRQDGSGRRMRGVPKQPRVNPGTLLNNATLTHILPDERVAALKQLPLDELWGLEEKYDVDVDTIYGPGTFQLDAAANAFILLNWSHDDPGGTRIEPIRLRERDDLMRVIMKSPGPFHWLPGVKVPENPLEIDPEPFFGAFEGMDVYEITGAVDFPKAVELGRSLLAGKAP